MEGSARSRSPLTSSVPIHVHVLLPPSFLVGPGTPAPRGWSHWSDTTEDKGITYPRHLYPVSLAYSSIRDIISQIHSYPHNAET